MTTETDKPLQQQIEELKEEIARLQQQINLLKLQISPGLTYGPISQLPQYPYSGDVRKCDKCLKIFGSTSVAYCCPNDDCPMFIKAHSVCEAAPEGCTVEIYSSRVCERGTKSCTKVHRPNPAHGAPKPPDHNPVA